MATAPAPQVSSPDDHATEVQDSSSQSLLSDGSRYGAVSATLAVLQGVCAFMVMSSSLKVAIGLGSFAAATASSRFHSAPVRIPLMIAAAIGATLTLYVLWNGWRLRRRPSAQWRRRPLTAGQRSRIALALGSAVFSWALVIAELLIHYGPRR